MTRTHVALLGPAIAGLLLSGCGGRTSVWDTYPSGVVAQGLQRSVALVDSSVGRVLMLSASSHLTLTPTSIPLGHGFATSATTLDGSSLLVLCHGDVPVQTAADQKPSLEVIAEGTPASAPSLTNTYALSSPLSNLAIDPQGTYAVVYASSSDSSFVENPNELSIVDLTKAPNPSPGPHGREPRTPYASKLRRHAAELRVYAPAPDSGGQTAPSRGPNGPRRWPHRP